MYDWKKYYRWIFTSSANLYLENSDIIDILSLDPDNKEEISKKYYPIEN